MGAGRGTQGAGCRVQGASLRLTLTSLPRGLSSVKYGSSGARPEAVSRITSKLPARAASCAASSVLTKPDAPKPRASASLSAVRESA